MQIKLIRGVVVNGKACHPGDVVDAEINQAAYLVAVGKAVVHVEEEPTITLPPKKGRSKKES